MNLFFAGQDAINVRSVSQRNLDTSSWCPALKSDSGSCSEMIIETSFTISFKLEHGILQYCLKNKRSQASSLNLAKSTMSSVATVNYNSRHWAGTCHPCRGARTERHRPIGTRTLELELNKLLHTAQTEGKGIRKSSYSHRYTADKLFPPPCTMDI